MLKSLGFTLEAPTAEAQRELYPSVPSSLPLKRFSGTLFPPSSSPLSHNTKGFCAKQKKMVTGMWALPTRNTPLSTLAYAFFLPVQPRVG